MCFLRAKESGAKNETPRNATGRKEGRHFQREDMRVRKAMTLTRLVTKKIPWSERERDSSPARPRPSTNGGPGALHTIPPSSLLFLRLWGGEEGHPGTTREALVQPDGTVQPKQVPTATGYVFCWKRTRARCQDAASVASDSNDSSECQIEEIEADLMQTLPFDILKSSKRFLGQGHGGLPGGRVDLYSTEGPRPVLPMSCTESSRLPWKATTSDRDQAISCQCHLWRNGSQIAGRSRCCLSHLLKPLDRTECTRLGQALGQEGSPRRRTILLSTVPGILQP